MKPFKKKLNKMRAILIQEMRDGCLECRKIRGLCGDHKDEVTAMVLTPKKTKLAEEMKTVK